MDTGTMKTKMKIEKEPHRSFGDKPSGPPMSRWNCFGGAD